MANVSIDQLAGEITKAVKAYTEDVSAAINQEVKTTADKIVKELRNTAPKKTGEYRKGFKQTNKSLPGKARYFVWNKKHYRLVHLLEFGHAKRGGGRVAGRPHLRPAHDQYAGQLERNIKQIIRNGG